jgi:signal transduction histidine kinase
MASVPAEEEVPEAPRSRRLLPNVRPVTTLLATGVVWITGLLVACCLAGGYLRHQVLNTTADELRRLDAVLAEATTRSLQGIEPILERLADRLPGSSDISAAAPRSDAAALENAGLLQQVIEHSGQIDAIARIGPEGKVLGTVGAWPANLAEIADKNYFTGRAAPSSRARFVGAPIEDVQAGTFRLPVAQLILGEGGTPAGGIVALVPLAKLTASFETAPLADDTRIAVIGPDGRVLARYPALSGEADLVIGEGELRTIFAAGGKATLRESSSDQEWRIEAIRPLTGYPLAIAVSRGASAALADWRRQMWMVGFFAIGGALAIGLMMYLISRQIDAHDELVAVRGDKLEAERTRLEAETKLLKVERLAVLGHVTGAVARELRVPLNGLREALDTLKGVLSDSGSELERPLTRMEHSLERCDRMSSDLVEYTKTRELQSETIKFDEWLTDIVAEQKSWVPFKLNAELRAGNAIAAIDPARIQRLLLDLIENACQAMDDMPAEYEKGITVRTGIAPGLVVLTVIDTGPGIAPENQEHIFEPLFSTKSYGTGLGLSIVKQIVDQHGGIMRVDSEPGHGTRVRVCLPLAAEALLERPAPQRSALERIGAERRAAA